MPLTQNPQDSRRLGLYMALAQVGTEMVVPAVLGLILDFNLDWTPWGLLVGVVLGLVGGFYHMIAILKQLKQRDE
jgi:F0F1-type ATP synthase assembly protein I